jgi:hypothetical protein
MEIFVFLTVGLIGLCFGLCLIFATITGKAWIERTIARDNFFPWPVRGRLFNQTCFVLLGFCLAVFFGFILYDSCQKLFITLNI